MEFLSDHGLVTGAGTCAAVAALAWLGDHRRSRRTELDRVGIMPWQTLFFWAFMLTIILSAAALQDALASR